MEPPLLTLVFVVFGFLIFFYALQVESQLDSQHVQSPRPPRSPPPRSPPPSPAPPRPLVSLPPPSPSLRSPPPSSPPAPVPPPSPPRSSLYRKNHGPTPPPRPNKSHRSPPPPLERSAPPRSAPPSRPENRINAGKKIGLLFTGIAAILQIGVISFLVFKRRQILRVNDRYESCS